MFCPKCATQNLDGARFCRACGADISLVPQAMSGRLPEYQANELEGFFKEAGKRHRRRKGKEPPSLDKGIKNIFMGVAFLLVAISIALFAPGGRLWWFWMLLPTFTLLGGGISEIVRFKLGQKYALPVGQATAATAVVPPARHANALPSQMRRDTGELAPPPPSVAEGTTRHLGAEAPTRHISIPVERSEKDV